MSYKKIEESVEFIKSKSSLVPDWGIVLGSGLGDFVEKVEVETEINYADIPHFHSTTVVGHSGKLILGKISGKKVAILQGRLHPYEGHDMMEVVHPIRTLGKLGIQGVILTNAAGGINPSFVPGDLVIIKDHINLMGRNPLIGTNIEELGPRFPDMTEAYSSKINETISAAAQDLGQTVHQGVYCSLLGPTYETPAEIQMLKIVGADMVGMSTVPESIAANHMGLKVAGISCITNLAAGTGQEKLDHSEVKEVANKVMSKFSGLIEKTLEKLP